METFATPLKFLDSFKQIRAERGLGGFYKGMAPLMIRGYFVNIILLPLYEIVKTRLNGMED